MSQILNKIRDVDANSSEAVKEVLAAFFQNLMKYKNIDGNRWLRALQNIINRFPKYCGTHRQTIELYVTHFLSSVNFFNVIEAAKCAHAVQQVRPAQEKAATAKYCWREQMIALCDGAHQLIDALFAKSSNFTSNNKERSQIQTSSTLQEFLRTEIDSLAGQDNAADRTTILSTRLRNVLIFIQAMLVEIYPVAKPIQPQLVLGVILQALSAPGGEHSGNVTSIKIQALRTLDALVACLGSNLIPFSALVFRFVMQTLKWSSDNLSEETSKVRVAAYSSLSKWLDSLVVHRPAADGQSRAWHDDLTTHIVSDVTPLKQLMQLTANAQPMKNLSKKARKRLANTMLKESNIASHMPGQKDKNHLSDKLNDEVAVAALECAETFLLVCGVFLKTTIHKEFQELLVRECFTIQDHGTDRAIYLLRALEACRKGCSVKVPPPTQYCLHLYSVLINSPHREISKFCSQALLDIRMHLHCSPASLSFTLEEQSLKKKEKEEGRKRTSARNRAALEKLLGIEWINNEYIDPNSVITIPDEPAAKRPREENEDSEVTENVSISSDSVHSVEMSSDSDDESLVESVEQPSDPNNDEVIIEPVEQNANSHDSGIHNEPTQVCVAQPQADIPDELVNAADNLELTQEVNNLAIHDQPTQVFPIITVEDDEIPDNIIIAENVDAEVEKIMDATDLERDVHEAKTQLLQNCDTTDGKSPSMEIVYDDCPKTGTERVTVLEKMDDENLPSTNDTDDIQITCGQFVKSSQDLEVEKSKDDETVEMQKDVTPKINGIAKSIDNEEAAKDIEVDLSKVVSNAKVVTVEDMLADFVDEVVEE